MNPLPFQPTAGAKRGGGECQCRGLFRFCFNSGKITSEVFQWPKLAIKARIPDNIKKRLLSTAKKASVNSTQWFGVIGSISIEGATLERYEKGVWIEIEFSEAQPVENGLKIEDASATMKFGVNKSDWANI